MDPVVGLILLLVIAAVAGVIAAKRNRSGLGFFGLGVLPVVPVMLLMSSASGGDHTIVGWAAFVFPLIALIASICVANGKEVAARHGAHGDFTRCPFCAEPVRREAIRCRHCAADLTATKPR